MCASNALIIVSLIPHLHLILFRSFRLLFRFFVSFYFQYHKINIFEFYSPFFFSSSSSPSVSYTRAAMLTRSKLSMFASSIHTYDCVGLIWLRVLCVAYMPFTHIIGIREFWCEPPCLHIPFSFLVLLLISLYFSLVSLVLRFVSLLLWKRRRRSRSHSHKYY